MAKKEQDQLAVLAKSIALACVRNGFLEDLHSGKVPESETGDYSDVKIITPSREIPWNEVSCINDEEIKQLMKEIVNKFYTILVRLEEPGFLEALDKLAAPYIAHWDAPELLTSFVTKQVKDSSQPRPEQNV